MCQSPIEEDGRIYNELFLETACIYTYIPTLGASCICAFISPKSLLAFMHNKRVRSYNYYDALVPFISYAYWRGTRRVNISYQLSTVNNFQKGKVESDAEPTFWDGK